MKKSHSILASLVLIFIWSALSHVVDRAFLPTPLDSFKAFFKMIGENKIQAHFLISSLRVLTSVALAVLLALPLAIVMGENPKVDSFISPFVTVLYPIPKVVFLPVFTVLLGLGNLPKILLITSIIFFQILVPVRDSVKRIPKESILAMNSITQSKLNFRVHLTLPWLLPELMTSLRISIGTAIAVLFFAETFASFNGLGYLILDAMERRSYSDMYAGIIAMAALGIILYEIIAKIENRYCQWKNN